MSLICRRLDCAVQSASLVKASESAQAGPEGERPTPGGGLSLHSTCRRRPVPTVMDPGQRTMLLGAMPDSWSTLTSRSSRGTRNMCTSMYGREVSLQVASSVVAG